MRAAETRFARRSHPSELFNADASSCGRFHGVQEEGRRRAHTPARSLEARVREDEPLTRRLDSIPEEHTLALGCVAAGEQIGRERLPLFVEQERVGSRG